ncbi:MAG TPA: FkbM family methyltransferase [Candidatus Binatia bacterium]|nr:FkbM family methyltransferase [Candidatus Binatia bacterium]
MSRRVFGRTIRWAIPSPGVLKALSILERSDPYLDEFLGLAGADDVLLDVGANSGIYSILCALGQTAPRHVIAIEPAPPVLDLLLKNLYLNRLGNRIQVIAAAAGETDGFVELTLPTTDPSVGTVRVQSGAEAARIVPRGALWRLEPGRVWIPIRAIDSLVEQGTIPPPTVVKVDVEGFEASVLRGMRRALASSVRVLLLELHHTLLPPGETAERVTAILHEAGLREWRSALRLGNQSHILFARPTT